MNVDPLLPGSGRARALTVTSSCETVLVDFTLRRCLVGIAAAIFGISPSVASPTDVGATKYAWTVHEKSTNEVAGAKRFAAIVDATAPRYFSDVGPVFG